MTTSPTLTRVLRGELCSGCGLCVGVGAGAVTMTTVAPGYSRPLQHAPLPPAAEAIVAAACPGAAVEPWGAAPHRHPYWGPYRRAATGFALDPRVRHEASSGGIVTALAIHALEHGLVERVLHVVADPASPTRNVMRLSATADEVREGAGSRYAASSPLAEIDALLAAGRPFAFVGKPCDVSALRRLATLDPRVDALVPIMLSFFCAGLPSHAGADRIVRRMGFAPDEVVAFRYRGHGWPGLTRAETADGRSATMRYADSWGDELSRELQFRCKICPDAVGGVADVAAADAWHGGETGYPLFEEADGRSLIMTRTVAGERLLAGAIDAGAVCVSPLAIDAIDAMQPSQARRKRLVAARLAACVATFQPRPRVAGLDVAKAARRASLPEQARNVAGTIRRIMTGRR